MVSGGSSRITLPHVPQVRTTTPGRGRPRRSPAADAASGTVVPGLHQLDGLHGAPAPHVADGRELRPAGPRRRSASTRLPIRSAAPARSALGHDVDGGQGGRAGDRVAAVGAAEAADVDVAHDLGPAGHRGQRQAAGDALGRGDQVGHDPLVLAREPGPGPAEPRLHLVGDEQDAVLLAPRRQGRQEAGGGHDEPAFALDRLDQDARHVVRADLLVDQVDGPGRPRRGPVNPAGSRNGYDIGTR